MLAAPNPIAARPTFPKMFADRVSCLGRGLCHKMKRCFWAHQMARFHYLYVYMCVFICDKERPYTRVGLGCDMSIVDDLVAISKNACSIITVSWISILIVGRIYDFHVAYISFIERTKSEEWLLEHCQDDHFFHKMAYHTDVCATVVDNSIIWPSLYGINESMSKMKLCGFYDCSHLLHIIYSGGVPVMMCVVLLYIVTPSFILPLLQRMYYVYCENVLMAKCSPSIRTSIHPRDDNHDRKHSMYYNLLDEVDSNGPTQSGKTRFV